MKAERPFPSELWEQIPAAVQGYIYALEARVTALEAAVQRLEATVPHLTERLQQDPHPSSRPPSSDPPQATTKRPRREPSGRRPGGQPGHEGQTRVLVSVEEVDVVISVKPERHQVTEIPPIKPVVTEYQLHQLCCPACGEATRGELPVGVSPGAFGPRVHAITALCAGAYHLLKRTTQSVL
jgi:transposase